MANRNTAKYLVDASGVRANLAKMLKNLPIASEQAMNTALNAGVRVAKKEVRKDTKQLMKSIRKTPLTKTKAMVRGGIVARAYNTSGKDYARYQELGYTQWVFGHNTGKWVEGTHYIYKGRKRAEEVLLKESQRQIRRLTKG